MENVTVKKIGFIGVGIMGKAMVRNLMRAGFEVAIYTRTKGKVEDVIAEGAAWCSSVRDCAAGREAVITMVGYPQDVEEVYFAEQGILSSADAGTYVIDMTTTRPDLAVRIYDMAQKQGLPALDAPVTGGDVGAREGSLTIMAGGDRTAFDACLPVFEAMGRNIVYQGVAGSGQHAKMANQIVIAGTLAGVCEGIAYAKSKGLDVNTLLKTISVGSAGSTQMNVTAPRMLRGDYAPGFFMKHFIKDMAIAQEEAYAAGIELSVLKRTLEMYRTLEAQGMGDLGTQALIKFYDKDF